MSKDEKYLTVKFMQPFSSAQLARSMTSQPLGTLGQALNCRLARGVGQLVIETSLSHK